MIEAQEEGEANQINVINQTVVKIYEILDDVATGKSAFSVKVEGYGLTKAGGSNGSSNAISGIAALNSTAANGTAGGITNSSSVSGNVSLGGWTMI
jgi:hypothetical protein